MKINVIGDVHGRDSWRQLVDADTDAVNVFVGDYFDPYETELKSSMIENFKAIVEYAAKHPGTILLYGNHDLHYIFPRLAGTCSRYNDYDADKIHSLFEDSKPFFAGVAYAPDDKHIITHAGVTKEWFKDYFGTDTATDASLTARAINELWRTSVKGTEFSFYMGDLYDVYGDNPHQSPMWVRPLTLVEHNLFSGTDVIQVFGHTQVPEIISSPSDGVVLVDCLGTITESYKFEV